MLNTATTTYALKFLYKFTCFKTGKNKHDMKKEKYMLINGFREGVKKPVFLDFVPNYG